MTQPIHEIDQLMQFALRQPPARAGLRLRSERDLSEEISLGRTQIRASLDRLVEQGVLVRRHGSGTYLRRLPQNVSLPQGALSMALPASFQMFAIDDAKDDKLQPKPDQCALRLSVWSGFHRQPSPNGTILQSMIDRATALGHQIRSVSMFAKGGALLSTQELSSRLKASSDDGYIVTHALAERFHEAYRQARGCEPQGVVYISPGYAPVILEPLIRMDTFDAMQRGVRILSGQGCQRIGVLSVQSTYHDTSIDRHGYQVARAMAGLDWHRFVEADANKESVQRAVKKLLGGAKRCDGIVVGNQRIAEAFMQAIDRAPVCLGKDLSVIMISQEDDPKPRALGLSLLEFNPRLVGQLAIDSLLSEVQSAGQEMNSLSHLAAWRPQQSHLRALGS